MQLQRGAAQQPPPVRTFAHRADRRVVHEGRTSGTAEEGTGGSGVVGPRMFLTRAANATMLPDHTKIPTNLASPCLGDLKPQVHDVHSLRALLVNGV